MTTYQSGMTLFGVDMRINRARRMDLVVYGDEVVAKANQLVRSLHTDKALAKDLLLKFKEDFNFALHDDLFEKEDVEMVLAVLERLEKRL